MKRLDSSIFATLRCARILSKGGPAPTSGGFLDQSNHFCDAFDQISAEQAAWKAKLKIPE